MKYLFLDLTLFSHLTKNVNNIVQIGNYQMLSAKLNKEIVYAYEITDENEMRKY